MTYKGMGNRALVHSLENGMNIDQRIAHYIKELNTESVVSTSHHTLHRMYIAHGRDTIDGLLAQHFKDMNDTRARLATAREAVGSGHAPAYPPR